MAISVRVTVAAISIRSRLTQADKVSYGLANACNCAYLAHLESCLAAISVAGFIAVGNVRVVWCRMAF